MAQTAMARPAIMLNATRPGDGGDGTFLPLVLRRRMGRISAARLPRNRAAPTPSTSSTPSAGRGITPADDRLQGPPPREPPAPSGRGRLRGRPRTGADP